MMESRSLAGQLSATDYDGDRLIFSLLSTPALGNVTLEPDGLFNYQPFLGRVGTDTFTFKVNDGELDSRPASVTINVLPLIILGQVTFENSSTNHVLDSRTGRPAWRWRGCMSARTSIPGQTQP
jgi:hypothetical protein